MMGQIPAWDYECASEWIRNAALRAVTILLMAPAAGAQTNSSITGAVRDTTSAVLPGVTVEVTSPALIEKVRSAITDATGLDRITELPPGNYAVTFTLPGFSSVRREGIELTTGFAATVNAELRVGDIAEAITVSGASPVVDVQNVVQQRVLTRDVIDAVPTAKNFATLGVLIPGVSVSFTTMAGANDVGGSMSSSFQMLMVHGSRNTDQRMLVDGLAMNLAESSGGVTPVVFPDESVEEINTGIGSHSAETGTGGVVINIVPKSGSNNFAGTVYGSYTNSRLQSNNLTDELVQRGLPSADSTNYIADVNPAIGGPIVRDQLWFHAGFRSWRTIRNTNTYYDANPADWVYVPDLSRGKVPQRDGGFLQCAEREPGDAGEQHIRHQRNVLARAATDFARRSRGVRGTAELLSALAQAMPSFR
jgi:hypothetical protein